MEEKDNVTLSDVERNKELFEYEMTEVILQLKGEFAKFTGKDLSFDESQVEVKKPEISEIPQVSMELNGFENEVAEVKAGSNQFDLPELNMPEINVDCKSVGSINIDSISGGQMPLIEKPETVIPNASISIEEVNVSGLDSESLSAVDVPSVPAGVASGKLADLAAVDVNPGQAVVGNVNVTPMQPITLSSAEVSKPEVTVAETKSISLNDNITAQVDKEAFDNIKVPVVGAVKVSTIDPNANGVQVSVEGMSANGSQAVGVDLPDMKNLQSKIDNIQEMTISPNKIPEVPVIGSPTINAAEVDNVALNSVQSPVLHSIENVSIPEQLDLKNPVGVNVPDVKKYDFSSAVNNAQNVNEAVKADVNLEIPDMKNISIGELNTDSADVNLPNMMSSEQIDISETVARMQNMAPVSVDTSEMNKIEIPAKKDVSEEIQSILDSIN